MSEEYLTAEMIEVLRQIHAEQKQTNVRLQTLEELGKTTNARLETLEDEFCGFRQEVREERIAAQVHRKDIG